MNGRRAWLGLIVFALMQAQGAWPAGEAFNPSPHAIDIPAWFKETFLDVPTTCAMLPPKASGCSCTLGRTDDPTAGS